VQQNLNSIYKKGSSGKRVLTLMDEHFFDSETGSGISKIDKPNQAWLQLWKRLCKRA